MNFSNKFLFSQQSTLTSGRFYWVQIKIYSYQVNEVERFRKNRVLHILGYLDDHENLHYFHSVKSQFSAQSSLAELSTIAGFYDWEFQELDPKLAIDIISERFTTTNEQLFQKVIAEFLPSSQIASEQRYSLEELLLDYHKQVNYAELKSCHST